jgi:serine/threonine-protein kinase
VIDQVREVAEAIVNLGIADEVRLAPVVKAFRNRVLGDSTATDDSEANDFLAFLENQRIIDRETRIKVEKILSGEITPRAKSRDAQDPFLGKQFGDFRAISKIGEGGMGSVYRAERIEDYSRDYVVKILSPLGADNATYVRFRREGQVMSALRHPNVVRVYTAGELDGLSWLVMDFVDGPTLQEVLDRKQRFDWMNAAKAVRQIALGLEAAHAIGVIHRDVKPQNVLLARAEGLLKVADFGLAKVHRAPSDPTVSRAGDILGSPAYIAPEQWGDHDVDQRADLFALGVVFYQLLTGVLPFRGKTPGDYARKILTGFYDAIELYSPEVPQGVRNVVARLLEVRRENRYQTATSLVLDVERCLRGEYPDVPRLVRNQGDSIERHVLLGRDHWTIGRAAASAIVIAHPTVPERHVLLERTPAGIILRELEARGLLRVNGMRVREITLKDNDVIEFGEAPPFRYRAGVGAIPPPQAGPSGSSPAPVGVAFLGQQERAFAPPLSVPGPIYEAYVRAEHARAVVVLIELLDETTWFRRTLRARRRLLAGGIADDVAGRAADRALASYRRNAAAIPDKLFRATKENLGRDPQAWLAWWFTKGREQFPVQVAPPGPRARASLALSTPSETGASVFPLSTLESWVLGRGSEAEVRFADRSVSRKHATIHRLLTRFAIVDDGSRFGTLLRGERKPVGLLRHDDTLELGRAKAVFRQPDDADAPAADGPIGIDSLVFDSLVEMRSPHVGGALVSMVDAEVLAKQVIEALVARGRVDEDLGTLLRDHLDERRRLALEALPVIAKKNFAEDAAAWREWWAQTKKTLPSQVMPEGWPAPS